MATEIERKFILIQRPDELLANICGEEIRQGYLVREGEHELRIRQRCGDCWMTVKQGSGLQRREEECRIPQEQFAMLWPLTVGARVEKTRYQVPVGQQTWEIDQFHGPLAPLLVLEVEFASLEESRAFCVPEWAVREVTEDPHYNNAALATCGLPESFTRAPT